MRALSDLSRVPALVVLGCVPMAAQAECLGQGCYRGLGTLLGLAIAFVVGVVMMIVLMVMRRWGAAKIVGLILGAIFFVALFMLGQ